MGTLMLGGAEYVVIPRAEYLRLVSAEDGAVPAEPFLLATVGRTLRAAREHAGLTQAELASKLKKAQTTVSQSEAGKIRVSEDYVRKVLKTCKLSADWKAP